MARALPLEMQCAAIVAMPLHWKRRWDRGFNKSTLLAREISKRWHVPVRNVVQRVRATTAQAGLTNAKRRLNMRGAFLVKTRLDAQRILLIDDVLTTGATVDACSRALKRAGAANVDGLTLARVVRPL